MMNMTPEQKLKHWILDDAKVEREITAENVDEIYAECLEDDLLWDSISARNGSWTEETNLEAPYSRHYESKSVASQMLDGSWVGWTHWYGGGKHGDPGSIEWMSEAYDLECREEEKLVIVRTWKKKGVDDVATD